MCIRDRIKSILTILLPIILPTAISFAPESDASRVVTSSGAEVPIATIVRPIMRGDILLARAIATEPLTK